MKNYDWLEDYNINWPNIGLKENDIFKYWIGQFEWSNYTNILEHIKNNIHKNGNNEKSSRHTRRLRKQSWTD